MIKPKFCRLCYAADGQHDRYCQRLQWKNRNIARAYFIAAQAAHNGAFESLTGQGWGARRNPLDSAPPYQRFRYSEIRHGGLLQQEEWKVFVRLFEGRGRSWFKSRTELTLALCFMAEIQSDNPYHSLMPYLEFGTGPKLSHDAESGDHVSS